MMLWATPHTIKNWKNFKEEEQPHTQWDDLFFDLIFVGVAYNVGHLLEHSGPSFAGFFDCFIIFSIASKFWQDKVLYLTKFDVDDFIHKIFNILEYCMVGLLACHINMMSGFTLIMLLHRIFVIFRWLEIYIYSNEKNAYRFGRSETWKNMSLIPIDALAVYLNFYHQHTITTRMILFVCFSSVLVDHFTVFFSVFCGTSSRENTVPSHISYFIHRVGEFTMLMVGESVLSLSALKNITPTLEFYVSLICGFILTSSIMFIQYSTSVFHAEKHVLRRSGKYGICWFHVKFMQAFFLVTFGVGLRILLQNYPDQKPPLNVLILFCGSLSMNVILAMVVECLQLGNNFFHHNGSCHVLIAVTVNIFALFLLPYLLYFTEYSKYENGAHCVIYAAIINLFQAICEAFDPNAKGIEGRFHHHIKHVTHAITAVHHLRKSTNLTKKVKKKIAFDRRQTTLLNPVGKKSKTSTSTKGNKKNK
jgi:low temperature requirement protein LtrA